MTPEDDDGTNIQVDIRKDQYRHNPGDIVVFESDSEPRERYEIVAFDDEEMKYITQAVSGDFKGKYRDSWEDELITPEPVSPDYAPQSPDYNPYGPSIASPDDDSPDFFEWQKQQEAKKLAEEKKDTPEPENEKELGSATDEKEEEAENILKTVSSINDKKINKGLDLLVPKEEDEDKKDEEEDDSSKTKKIT